MITGFVGVTGWAVARTAGASQVRAVAAGVIMLALGTAVVLAKAAVAPH
jgi:sulfite exporter TauE/SafE